MALGLRTRIEVFKRDDFTCRYCGRRSPEVVIEVDHIVPVCEGGSDDPINLTTACWECNRGKGGVPLASVMTGEEPHDRAIELLERKRQLEEYNHVLQEARASQEADAWYLWRYWQQERGYTSDEDLQWMPKRSRTWLMNTLAYCPRTKLIEFFDAAIAADATRDFRYVAGCLRNWREAARTANSDAVDRFETAVADIQRILDCDHDTAVTVLNDGNETDRVCERERLIEEVLLNIRDAEFSRRNRGYCHHDPPCTALSECIQREVRIHMGVPQSNGAPPQ